VRTITTKKGDRMAFVTIEDMNGNCDVTVFPKTYEKAREILEDGRIVLVRGKVDVRNDRASIVADHITNELPVRADSVQPKADSLQEPLPDYNAMPPTDFIPEDEDDSDIFINGELSWTPTYGQSESRPRPAPATAANGNGKDKSHPEPPAVSPTLTRTLHIRFSLTEDARLDASRLDETLQLLAEFPGEDRFTITIFDAHDQVRILFPGRKTRYCSDLVERLQRLLGKECLTVERE
jgi:DNA polymerase-3 subunit alpha